MSYSNGLKSCAVTRRPKVMRGFMCCGDLFKDSRVSDIEAHRTTLKVLRNVSKEPGFLAKEKEEKG